MSKLKKLNKLNKSKTLSVALAVGLVASNLVAVVPAIAAGSTNSALMKTTVRNSSIGSTSRTYYNSRTANIKLTMTNARYNTLLKITNMTTGTDLVLGTDYTYVQGLSTDKIEILKAYMDKQPLSTATVKTVLKFDMDNGLDRELKITVKGNAVVVDPAVAIAETKVAAYETAPITTLAEIAIAEGLKAPAETAVAAVTSATTKATLTDRITAQAAVIAAKKATLSTLDVSSVSAINKTTVQVTFSNAVDAVAVANFSVKVGATAKTIDTVALDATKKIATLTVQGLNFSDTVSVTVSGVMAGAVTLADYTTTAKVPALGDLFKLEVTCDDTDAVILADGATKTMLTAKLIEKATNTVKVLDGIVDFTTTKGGLAQGQVTLDGGKASVQLTSAASDASIVAFVTAVISQAPGATEYEGLTGALQVTFSPDAASNTGTTFVSVQKAESNQGDRFFVTYTGNITATDYKAALVKAAAVADWNTLVLAGTSGGMTVDGAVVRLSDIKQKAPSVLEFILDTDSDLPAANISVRPATSQIATPWIVGNTKNYLRDNATHSLMIGANVGDYVLATGAPVSFIMTDALKPFIYGVTPKDQLEFTVRFSESMAEDNVEGLAGQINDKFMLDGQKVRYIFAPNAIEIAAAKAANEVIVNQLSVGNYVIDTAAVDTRNIVTFKLDPNFKMATGVHQIQIANVSDWAGLVDVNNVVSTQTFDFNVVADDSKPVPTLTQQSPEQWLVTFDELVTVKTAGKTMADAVKIFKADDAVTPLVYGTDYVVTPIDVDGNNLAAPGTLTTATKYWLIETTKDWTTYFDTAGTTVNYFTSTKNPFKVTVDLFEDALVNVMTKTDLALTLSYDGTSPTIASAVDVDTLTGKTANTVVVTAAGQAVFVKMSEPVQLKDAANTPAKMSTPLTQSQQQAAGAGIPVPTFEFVKGDLTVPGTITSGSIEEADKDFVVTPANVLEAGTWTLYIRSISDDIGNTSATVSTPVTVPATASAVTDTKVAWAAFDNATNVTTGKDYLYVKFTKVMNAADVIGVSRTTNYVYNGVALPLGSQVYKGIAGVTTEWDGVTIEMPGDAFIPGVNAPAATNATSVLNVANNFKAADGEALSGPFEVQLVDDAAAMSVAQGDMDFEAEYVNATASALIGGSPVVSPAGIPSALALDMDLDGKIDQVVLFLDQLNATAIAATDSILVGGKKFTVAAPAVALSTMAVIYNAGVDANEVAGTNTATLAITNANGAKLITNRVVDAAAPVITSAVLNSAKDKLVVTFSENVTTNATYPTTGFATTITADYTPTLTGGAVATVAPSGHVVSAANTVTFTVTGGSTILSTDTIAPALGAIYDYAAIPNAAPIANVKAITGAISVTGAGAGLGAITQGSAAVAAQASVDNLLFAAGWAAGDTIVIDGVTLTGANGASTGTTFDTTTDTVLAIATAVKASVDLNATLTAKYNVVDALGFIQFTQKPGQESAIALNAVYTTAGAGTATVFSLVPGVAAVAAQTESALLTVTGPVTAAGSLLVTLTNPAMVVSVPVTVGMTATQVATAINTALGAVAGYTVVDNANGTLTFTSTAANTNVADLTVTVVNQ